MPEAVQLYYWRGEARNFGDELNVLLWPRLLPDFFDENPAELFLGIGSVLDARHAPDAVKLVAGAGYGGYERAPTLDATWVVHWVRGPDTARLLGLPEECGLGDPAMLIDAPASRSTRAVGFMPHFESMARGSWAEAAHAAGVSLIDPRGDPATILAAIGNCRLLLGEAMHGVIVADAMRVPWVALRPLVAAHRAKWHDWAGAMGLAVRFHSHHASSLCERLHASMLATSRPARHLLDQTGPLLTAARQNFIGRAAESLSVAAAAAPQLSSDTALDRSRTKMLERLEALRRCPWRPTALHSRGTSAYQH